MLASTGFFTLDLAGARPVAQGKEKVIYEHPRDSSVLVKVHNADLRLAPNRLRHRAGRLKAFSYELTESVALRGRFPGEALPIEKVIGLADTDLGLGLMVEKVVAADGSLGVSLRRLVRRHGLTPDLQTCVEAFLDSVNKYGLIFTDMNASNLVLGVRAGREALVMVDGFGDKNLIPLRSLCASYNHFKNARQARQLREQLTKLALLPRRNDK